MNDEKSISSADVVNLFAYNVAGIYESTPEGRLLQFNQAFAEILGYDTVELANIDGAALYYDPTDRDSFVKEISAKRNLRNREVRYVRKDGSSAWCIESAFLTNRNGESVIVGTLTDITEQKRTEQRFQALFYASGDAIFILEDGRIVQANKRCCDIFGYASSDLQGRLVHEKNNGLFHFTDAQRHLIRDWLTQECTDVKRISALSQRKDGSQFHSEITLTHFNADSCTQHQLIVRDISERVLHEEALRESEARFKLLSDIAIEGIVFTVNDQIRDCNTQFVNLLGYARPEELLGKQMAELINELDFRRLKQVLDIRGYNRTEIRAERRDGQMLFLEATGSRIEYRHEVVTAYLFYNITQRKKTEQALEQSTERFKSLVEHSPNGIFILTDGRVRYVNQSGLQLLQYDDEDDIYDDSFVDFFHSEEQAKLRDNLRRVRDGEEIEQQEFKVITSTGEQVQVGVVTTLTVYDGRPSIQVTLNNLNTQIKLVQETLRAQLAEEINVVLKREIEEHKNTQKKLRQAENFTRNIIQSSIDMILAMDKENRITEFNLAAQKQFGYSPKQIEGKPGRRIFADEKEYNRVQESIRLTGTYTGEVVNKTRQGKLFTSFLSASVIRNDDGEPIGSMGVSRDITEIKKAEQELRESEERYRDLFENATDFIFSVDMEGNFIYANRSFCETMGYTDDELKKLSLIDVVAGLNSASDVLTHFAGITQELEFRSKSGKKISVFGDSSVRKSGNKPVYLRAIYRDITELRRQEQMATEQSAKLESVFNSTENLMMWTMNLSGQLTSFNNNFSRWLENDFGYKPEKGEDIIVKMGAVVNADAYQGQLDTITKAFSGQPRQFELPLRTISGHSQWFQVFVNPVRVGDKMEEVSCLAYDITDRKEIDRRILASLKEKEVLLQEVHHRVKNNLQVISSILNLQSSFVSDENVLEVLKESQSRIKTMSYIHEKLYQTADFSSIEFTDYITSLSRNLVQSYAPGDARIKLDLDFDDIYLGLDQAIPCGLIVNELVSNALKYAFRGRNEGTLRIGLKQIEERIELRIDDNGVGLPEGFKYENSESLGIYLVYALVEQLDATIDVDSSSEKGTCFTIRFDKIDTGN